MASANGKYMLTAFSPSLDYFAISSGDGRIKIWDTVNGNVQTEFVDITANGVNLSIKPAKGHLSFDYTCMKWLSLDRKRKRKLASSLLVLGTASGDLVAFDVSSGQVKWTVSDCHPGGVTAISFSPHNASIYTAGADGMICYIDSQARSILGKFKAFTKAVSCMSISPDGKTIAIAASRIRIFSCHDHKKIQKFSGHPAAVRSLIFTGDGKYVLSSAVGERYVAVWRIDGGRKQSASCVLAMEHPAITLDSMGIENEMVDGSGLHVLAISETGICYTWCGSNVEDLRIAKPTKILAHHDEESSRTRKGLLPAILAAKLQGISTRLAAYVFLAYGFQPRPSFQKLLVQSGKDVELNSSLDGVLLPAGELFPKVKKGVAAQSHVITALDRSNVEDALYPISQASDFKMDLFDIDGRVESMDDEEMDMETMSMEEKLRQLNVIPSKDETTFKRTVDSLGIDLKDNTPYKMRETVSSLKPSSAYELLQALLSMWKSGCGNGKHILPWMYCILINHGHFIVAQDQFDSSALDSLLKIAKSRAGALKVLLQLSGRLRLVTAQIDKACSNKTDVPPHSDPMDDDDDDHGDGDDEVEDLCYREQDDQSEIDTDTDTDTDEM